MNKMLVDGGASVNLMPYTTFHKLGKGPRDLIEIDMMLKNFRGKSSKTKGAMNVELTIGSKTLLTTSSVFLANYGKEASLESMMKANSRSKQTALKICFNG